MSTTGQQRQPHPPYQAALDWLYSFVNSEKKHPASRAEFNLPRTGELLYALGQPQLGYPAVTVAGTKGKGSTSAMIEAILRAAGLRCGLYTSPHLHSFRERIQIDRELLPRERLVQLVAQLKPVVSTLDASLGQPSTYELTTALGLLYFAQERVDCAVLEIGLGGRYDSVNVVTPLLAVLTPISYDHMDVLGHTLAEIAFEKAGIIKPGVPVVTAPQHPEAAAVIEQVARDRHAPLFVAEERGLRRGPRGKLAHYPLELRPSDVSLHGSFQLDNARLALSAALLLRHAGQPVPNAAMLAGLAGVRWPARLELLRQRPQVLVDGAQNGDSAAKLAVALAEEFRFERLILVLGASADKDLSAIAAALAPSASAIVLTRSRHPRSASLEALRAAVSQQPGEAQLLESESVASAIEQALRLAAPDDMVCATGSLFVAAEAREFFGLGEPE